MATALELRSWVNGMAERGVRLGGGSLRSASLAKLVSVRDGETLVSDGPFAETKEQAGRKTIGVEVRPIEPLPWEQP